MAKNKYYAVAVGKTPGIYLSWPECEAQVKGFPNAKFKGFPDEDAANAYMKSFSDNSAEDEAAVKEDPFLKEYAGRHAFIYVDGSYNGQTDYYGYGVYVEDGKSSRVFSGGDPCKFGGNNIEGEIRAATIALDYAKNSGKYDSVTICHDLQHIGLIGDHTETPHTLYTIEYRNFVDSVRKSGLAVDFIHTKGHVGIEGNEYVDKLAKIGCGIPLTASEQRLVDRLKDVEGFPKQREIPEVSGMTNDAELDFGE